MYPKLDNQQREVDIKYINDCLGLQLNAQEIADLLSRMALEASPSEDGQSVSILIPPTRTDVLHNADVMEVKLFFPPLLYLMKYNPANRLLTS